MTAGGPTGVHRTPGGGTAAGRGGVTTAFSHLGICVSDLEASLRFYCEGLGFEEVAAHEVGEEFAALMEVDGVRLRSRMVRRDGVTLELLDFVAPGTTGDGDRRPMNRLGLTHLSLRVDDVDGGGRHHRGAGRARWCGAPGPPSTSGLVRSTSCTAPTPTGCASS